MAHDVFISYANEDKTIADAVCANLEQRGIRCWIAPRDVSPGVYYAQAIITAIKESRAMALIFSVNANRSQHVVREAEQAVRAGIPIIPFRIDTSSPAEMLSYYIGPNHWLDAVTLPVEAHIQRLGDAIESLLKTSPEHLAPNGIESLGLSGAQVGDTTAPPGRGVSVGARRELAREKKPSALNGLVWPRRLRSRIFAGALAAMIVVIIIAAGVAFHTPLVPSATPATPNLNSERPQVLGAGTIVLTASDYVNPNSTLLRGDNIIIQLFQSGTYLRRDKTGDITGSYTLYTPDGTHTTYDLYLNTPNPYSDIVLQQNHGFSWSQRDLNATEGFTDLYSGQYTWSTPFRST
jgi:hypothetical protein